jgi:hypothetical protein
MFLENRLQRSGIPSPNQSSTVAVKRQMSKPVKVDHASALIGLAGGVQAHTRRFKSPCDSIYQGKAQMKTVKNPSAKGNSITRSARESAIISRELQERAERAARERQQARQKPRRP